MSKKNFTVATAENGKTTKQDTKHAFATTNISKDKTPTGKVKTIKDKEAIRKEREENYRNFRINALKRRAKRLKLDEKKTQEAVDKLIAQLDTPNSYDVLLMYTDPKVYNLLKEALNNEGIVCKIITSTYAFLVSDKETLATLREIAPTGVKICPYVKKKEPVLPVAPPKMRGAKKHTKAEKKNIAAAAKKACKEAKIKYYLDRSEHAKARKEAVNKKKRTEANHKILFQKRCEKASKKRQKTQGGTTVQLKPKKGSNASKKASMNLKKAA